MSDTPSEPFWKAMANASAFFRGGSDVHRAFSALARLLEEIGVPYAFAGGIALNAYGYEHVTRTVSVLLTREGLEKLKTCAGYVEKSPGSKAVRDTTHGVEIEVLIAGDYPGDRKPKPVRFPDPATVAERRGGAAFLPLPLLIQLKLASGLSAPHRLRDLADVLEIIRAAKLPRDLGSQLDVTVRAKFDELWLAAQHADPQ
jgi:hypothetical protein